jgi:hypothetical protein
VLVQIRKNDSVMVIGGKERGEPVEPDPFFDPPVLDEFVPFSAAEPEPPEA